MGFQSYLDVIAGLTTLEISINKIYKPIKLGTGIEAAEK